MNFSAVILAGGQSSRMGRDKAWLEIKGESLLARQLRIIRTLKPAEVFISGRPDVDYSGLGCPVLLDLQAGFGPLGGIERGLQATASPLLLVVAVDLAGMTTDFLRKLCGHCDGLTGAVPKLNGGLEPLAAIYPKRCHSMVKDLLTRSRRTARGFADLCLEERVVRAFRVAKADAGCLANWNSPEDTMVPGRSKPGARTAKSAR